MDPQHKESHGAYDDEGDEDIEAEGEAPDEGFESDIVDDEEAYGDVSRSRSASRRPHESWAETGLDGMNALGSRGVQASTTDQRVYARVRGALRPRPSQRAAAVVAASLAASAALADIDQQSRRSRAARRRQLAAPSAGAATPFAAAVGSGAGTTSPLRRASTSGLAGASGRLAISLLSGPRLVDGQQVPVRGRLLARAQPRRRGVQLPGNRTNTQRKSSKNSAAGALGVGSSEARAESAGRALSLGRGATRGMTRATTGAGVDRSRLVGPREDNCYACCLAESVDFARMNAAWLKGVRRRAGSAAQAAAEERAAEAIAVACAGAGRPTPVVVTGSGLPRRGPFRARSQSNSFSDNDMSMEVAVEVQIVALNKEALLLKVGTKDCFVFAFGCLVCWACTLAEVRMAKDALRPFLNKPFADQDVDDDHIDTFGDEVPLSSSDPPVFERVALACALAQSVRLGSLELRIVRCIGCTREIPQHMASTGEVSMSNRQVTKMMGEMFVLRNQVNCETDILDTPEIIWEYSKYEPLYEHCRQHLDLDRRVEILNQRFEVLLDLFDFLETELNDRHATRLEWVVIGLVALEVFAMCLRLFQKVYHTHAAISHNHTKTAPSAEELVDGHVLSSASLLELCRTPILGSLWLLVRSFVVKPAAYLAKSLLAI